MSVKPKIDELFIDVWDGFNGSLHEELSEPFVEYSYGKLPRAYPILPRFGILYLSVPRAASLIVRDMYERQRYPFDTLFIGTPQFGRRIAKLQQELTAKIHKHIIRAVKTGRLRAVDMKGDYKDFIDHGDEGPATSHTHIFYGDLVNWLINSGYEDSKFLSVGPAFEEYEQQELNLGKEVEHLIRTRRELQGYDASELSSDENHPGVAYEIDIDEAVSRAADEIRDLKRRLLLAPASSEGGQLHKKEQDSILIILAALLELRGVKARDKELISNIQRSTERMGHSLSVNTVRKWLKEAIDLIPRPKDTKQKSIDA
jgi:hypothetical protein